MAKEDKRVFVSSKLDKHFKMDKQTKRMLALTKFPQPPKLTANEQLEQSVTLHGLTKSDYKTLMMKGQLSDKDSKYSGMNDPLWKPKKNKNEEGVTDESSDNVAGTKSAKSRKSRKAKPVTETRVEESAAQSSS